MRQSFKKSLGQNFLIDKNIISKIVRVVSEAKLSQNVIEIGAGSGFLTEPLSRIYKHVLAVEIDKSLSSALMDKFNCCSNVSVINRNFLKTDINKFWRGKIDIFGNIPYNITKDIFHHLFKYRKKINNVYLTIQKDVFDKIRAKTNDQVYGYFSCLVNYFLEVKDYFFINPGSFFPQPKIRSVFVHFVIKKQDLTKQEEGRLLKIFKSAFGQRRKVITNSLAEIFTMSELSLALERNGIDFSSRAENLSLEQYMRLAKC